MHYGQIPSKKNFSAHFSVFFPKKKKDKLRKNREVTNEEGQGGGGEKKTEEEFVFWPLKNFIINFSIKFKIREN